MLGLSPLVFFPGAGSKLYRGLGAVVLGGLLMPTVFTLFLVSTVFSLAMDTKARITSWFQRSESPAQATQPPRREEPVLQS